MENTQGGSHAKVGIFLSALLMMGVIGVSSSLPVIAAHFGLEVVDAVTGLISVSALVIIPITIASGLLMSYISKKMLLVFGIICFLAGGICPALMTSFGAVIAWRVVFGIGVGLVMTVCPALVAENYDGEERNKTMGTMNSFQMLGCIAMSIIGGRLGATENGAINIYFVHLIAVISLIAVILFVPYKRPAAAEKDKPKQKLHVTGGAIFWAILFFVFMFAGQVFSNNASSLITNLNIGTAAEAGNTIAIFAAGGFVMGFLFAKIFKALKNLTMPVGFFVLALSYVIMALGTNMMMQYIGAFICGLAFSICMPLFLTSASNSVDAATSAFAVSLATCFQNAGMALCPYVVNPVSKAMTHEGGLIQDQNALVFGAILIGVFGVAFLIRGIAQNAKEKRIAVK